ncbi:hypothetical protein JCM10914A_50660 [Paenibacillus sp. JCM 10914]|uniref:helix-turn-helix transcriptional regulator n=1 Tax=Paenibacillus sp. JCM 10914 TaxID=1236974 RepID=UPI0003CC4332|nr:helix-turn-helix domain-containing protein [Paenibacillus sp. JCM 10914]GAE08290.1 transcriptional regulator, AraC family [Paenibacillus sp. JCM 10914]
MSHHFPYEAMKDRKDSLERLDLRIHWGHYEIRVLRFHLTSFPPGKIVSFHKHAEYEFHFIPRGKGTVIMEETPFALREGLFYLTGPNVLHYQEASSDEAMDELCLHVDIIKRDPYPVSDRPEEESLPLVDPWEVAEAEDCMEKISRLPLKPTTDLHRAMPYFLEAFQASQDKFPGLYTTIKQCIIQILLRAVRAYEAEPLETDYPSRDMKAYRYQLALEYINANASGEVVLEDVADKLHISSRQLQRIFKDQAKGRSFSEILEHVRLESVCRRLTETNWPIDKIALSEGFSSGSYLHTVFRKRYGYTPSAYRTMNVK